MTVTYAFLVAGLCLSTFAVTKAQPVRVELRDSGGNCQLFRDGKPYYIKGAGGRKSIEKIQQYGGNSIRTWGTNEKAGDLLDQAQANGLTVLMGLPVLPPRHDSTFYGDVRKMAVQKERCRALVLKFKDHPAVLMWALGNELDIHSRDRRVYDAVNDLAEMIKAIDPTHPVITVMGGFSEEIATVLKTKCPAMDMIGINYYGDLTNLARLVAKAGWTKPYAITEWGPVGHWMAPRTSWGAYIEQTSSQKADLFQRNYNVIKANPLCLGSYVFYWDTKQEKTITWYSMFTRSGEEYETVDAMNKAWNGTPKPNRSPRIRHPLTIVGKAAAENISLLPGTTCKTSIPAFDPDDDPLSYEWIIIPETTSKAGGGDFEAELTPVDGLIKKNTLKQIEFNAPPAGRYRLFVFVRDGHNHVATANCPFAVP